MYNKEQKMMKTFGFHICWLNGGITICFHFSNWAIVIKYVYTQSNLRKKKSCTKY